MKKLYLSTLFAGSLLLFGCAPAIVEQKGVALQAIPQTTPLKVKTAKPLALRTETANKNCDVTTFFQVMSAKNPEIQNIIEIHYSETELPGKTECAYWGIGVTYEGVESGSAPQPATSITNESEAIAVDTSKAPKETVQAAGKPALPQPKEVAIPASEAPAKVPAEPEKPTAPEASAAAAEPAADTAKALTQPNDTAETKPDSSAIILPGILRQ